MPSEGRPSADVCNLGNVQVYPMQILTKPLRAKLSSAFKAEVKHVSEDHSEPEVISRSTRIYHLILCAFL